MAVVAYGTFPARPSAQQVFCQLGPTGGLSPADVLRWLLTVSLAMGLFKDKVEVVLSPEMADLTAIWEELSGT